MTELIGELFYKEKVSMLKMWRVKVPEGLRQTYRHFHTRFEISLITRGSGKYLTEKGSYPLAVGDVMVFPSNEFHSVSEAGEEGLEFINLQFEPIYIQGKAYDTLSEKHLNFCFSRSDDFKNRIKAEEAAKIAELFSLIEGELCEKTEEYPLAVKSYLNLIIIELIRNHGYCPEADTTRLRDVIKVMKHIDSHISEPLTLSSLADLGGMTPNYFSALFRRLNGISLWDYITSRRVEQAIRLISSGDNATLLEIALSCGFNNTANFNKAFKKQTGVTPSYMRKNPEYLNS